MAGVAAVMLDQLWRLKLVVIAVPAYLLGPAVPLWLSVCAVVSKGAVNMYLAGGNLVAIGVGADVFAVVDI